MAQQIDDQPLITARLLSKLEHLAFQTKRPMRSVSSGSRRSRRHGASIEFSDYREYVRGDDLRYVDWKAYARLEKLFVKLYLDEDDLTVHLLLDSSQSMAFGEPVTKLRFAKQFSAALGAIALLRFDRFTITQAPSLRTANHMLRGRSAMANLLRHLEQINPQGQATISSALAQFSRSKLAPGMLVIVSDFYEHGLTRGLLTQLRRRFDVVLVHVLAPEELDPALFVDVTGEVRLIDSESSDFVELTINQVALDDYRANMNTFCDDLSMMAKSAGAMYLHAQSDLNIEEFVLDTLRRARLIR